MWTYKGINVWTADRNSSGIRWEAFTDQGRMRADSKAGMRQLITETGAKAL
jgi:hypothetical protein